MVSLAKPCIVSYFDVIKNPMDLRTMGAKIEQGQYKNRFEFEADFRLMIDNAKQYNVLKSYVHNEALALEAAFDRRTFICPPYAHLSLL